MMVVENQTAPIGTEAVARAAPDGNTLLVINNNFVGDSHFRKLAYNPLTDFVPICNLATAQTLVVVNSSSPYRALSDLINAAREKPGTVTMSANPGSATHLGMDTLKRLANVNMPLIPGAGIGTVLGGSPTMSAVLNGQATWSIQTYQNSLEHMKTGRLRALATASRKRLEVLSDLPTVAESGYKDFDIDLWDGVFAPANTPKESVSELAGWFGAAVQQSEVKSKIGVEAFIPVGVCGADFVAFIRKQHDEYGRIIREGNIKPQ
jgi:tripartite-type tricarboxylate transporter receptor subunit TctC